MDKINILDGERIDDTGFGGLKLIQDPAEFCYGIDSVLLADFASKNHGIDRRSGSRSGSRQRSCIPHIVPQNKRYSYSGR